MTASKFIETLRLLRLFLIPAKRCRPEKIYDLLSTHNNLAEQSLYLNLGYWKSASSYDSACEALAELLGQRALLNSEDRVLDVGCGFGDADHYWLHRYDLGAISAINVTRSQLTRAKIRFNDERIQFSYGEASNIPFKDASFNKLLSLESAFHFEPRDTFFAEAFRVLEPGGRLALADVVSSHTQRGMIENWVAKRGRALWQTPECNLYGREVYLNKLKAAGFQNIEVSSIAEHVFVPFKTFAKRRINDRDVRQRVHPLLRKIWGSSHGGLDSLDYLIITATRQ